MPALPPRLRVDREPGGEAEGWMVGGLPQLFGGNKEDSGGNKGDSVLKEELITCSIEHQSLLCAGSDLP